MSVPGYALYRKHQGEPPLSDSEISELKRKISEAKATLRTNLKKDWKKSTAAVAEFICPFCLHVLPGLYLTEQRKWNRYEEHGLGLQVCGDTPGLKAAHAGDRWPELVYQWATGGG
ncbi:hypothetical protein MCOR02_011325 [Pyricularia oryzae]|nr:hypothetical protein MCOR02_011325 [Pyricularia oryzae]